MNARVQRDSDAASRVGAGAVLSRVGFFMKPP